MKTATTNNVHGEGAPVTSIGWKVGDIETTIDEDEGLNERQWLTMTP